MKPPSKVYPRMEFLYTRRPARPRTGWEPPPWHATQRAAWEALESGLRRLGHCSLRHSFAESTLFLQQSALSLSDQDIGPVAELLDLFHESLRRLPHRLRPESYFRGQHRAAEEMCANGFGKVLTTPRAHVSAASVQDVGGEFRVAEANVTGRASGDDVPRAVDEDQRSLFRCEDVRALAVNVR